MLRIAAKLFIGFVVILSCAYAKEAKELIEEGNEKRFAGDQNGAIALYDRAISLSPLDAYAFTMRGFAYTQKKDFEKSLADFRRAVQLAPNDSIYHNNLANALLIHGDIVEASAEYDQAIHLDPKNITTYIDRSKFRYTREDYSGAISDLTTAASTKPPYPAVYTIDGRNIDELALIYKLLGDAKLKIKDYNGAISAFTKAIAETHKYPSAYEGRATANDALGKAEEAKRDRQFAQQIKNNPDASPENDLVHNLKDLLRSLF